MSRQTLVAATGSDCEGGGNAGRDYIFAKMTVATNSSSRHLRKRSANAGGTTW